MFGSTNFYKGWTNIILSDVVCIVFGHWVNVQDEQDILEQVANCKGLFNESVC